MSANPFALDRSGGVVQVTFPTLRWLPPADAASGVIATAGAAESNSNRSSGQQSASPDAQAPATPHVLVGEAAKAQLAADQASVALLLAKPRLQTREPDAATLKKAVAAYADRPAFLADVRARLLAARPSPESLVQSLFGFDERPDAQRGTTHHDRLHRDREEDANATLGTPTERKANADVRKP